MVKDEAGRRRFSLGPVEVAIVVIIPALLLSALGLVWSMFVSRLDAQGTTLEKQGETMQTVVTQQAVTNGQLTTISAQLADVPALTRQMAEIKVRVESLEERQKEQRGMKGLR